MGVVVVAVGVGVMVVVTVDNGEDDDDDGSSGMLIGVEREDWALLLCCREVEEEAKRGRGVADTRFKISMTRLSWVLIDGNFSATG